MHRQQRNNFKKQGGGKRYNDDGPQSMSQSNVLQPRSNNQSRYQGNKGQNQNQRPQYEKYGQQNQPDFNMDCDEFSVNSHQGYSKQKPSMHRDNPENKSTPFFNMHKDNGYAHKENMMSHSNSGYQHNNNNGNQYYSDSRSSVHNKRQDGNGYRRDRDRDQKPMQFGSKPQMSSYSAMSTNSTSAASHSGNNSYHHSPKQQNNNNYQKAVVPANRGRGGGQMPMNQSQVQIFSNQYRLKLSENTAVYQYVIDIKPDEMWEAERVHAIIKTKRSALEKALGAYVVSGRSIYILNELDDSLEFATTYRGERCCIKIDKDYGQQVVLTNDFVNKENSVSQNLLNVIIKQAFRETNLKQLGRSPRFFDMSNSIDLKDIKIWSGFKASAFQSEFGCTLAIDNIFKFMATKTCLQRIYEIKQESHSQHQFEQVVRLEFVNKSIIADWGNKRTYIVNDIDFEKNPINQTFMFNDKQTKIAEYFKQVYDRQLTDFSQPLFKIQVSDQEYYLPPELCLLDGVPDSIRKSPGMRDALTRTRINPQDKINKIQKMCEILFQQKAVKNWGLEIEPIPISLKSKVLEAPQIFQQNQIIQINDAVLRRLPIQKAVDLQEEEWIMIYQAPTQGRGRNLYTNADKVYNTFVQACSQLKISVQQPHFIETENEADRAEVEQKLANYMMSSPKSVFRHPTMVVVILDREKNYKMYKELFQEYKIPSQVITSRNAFSFNASKASNILRQINSKIGGDLFNLKFPEVMDSMRTMLIGIDVCHSGPNSVVGLACSINKEMSQYYSEYLVQKKGQEIVEDQMREALKKAIEGFAENHRGMLPTNYIIYRDGVGDAMRSQVLQKEVTQFKEVFSEIYNKVEFAPKVTLVVVNKRITQRFFIQDQNGQLMNPPSGCIVDRGLVENSGSEDKPDEGFDFFITPSSTTQGCVLPTHMHVTLNESHMKKIELQQLTYALCHYYFNWAGSIKVPAPCQYAHKIADFYVSSGLARSKKGGYGNKGKPGVNQEQVNAIKNNCHNVMPLAKRLHFL